MSVRSFGNPAASFRSRFGRTGTRASKPFIQFSVTGGTEIPAATTGNGYKYHVFLTSGAFTVEGNKTGKTAEVLIVAGGGCGGFSRDGVSGGGGAGGIVHYTTYPLGTGPQVVTPIVIGAGGAADDNGTDTTFGVTTAKGGGAGAKSSGPEVVKDPSGSPGGSGGGGAGYNGGGLTPQPSPGGSGIQPAQPLVSGAGGTNYGYDGGVGGTGGGNENGGGGGGAGSIGSNSTGPPSQGGAGGNGQPFPGFAGPYISPVIPAPNVPVIGPTGLYGGGGGGGDNSPPTIGPSPGGGAQTGLLGLGPAATGYGSGGGGAQVGSVNTTQSPAGSQGIVIVRYQV